MGFVNNPKMVDKAKNRVPCKYSPTSFAPDPCGALPTLEGDSAPLAGSTRWHLPAKSAPRQ